MTDGVLTSLKVWAIGAVVLATVLTSIPYVYGALYADADHQFTGIVAWHGDVFYYLGPDAPIRYGAAHYQPGHSRSPRPGPVQWAARTARLVRKVDGDADALLVPARGPRRVLGRDSAGGPGAGGHCRPDAARAHCGTAAGAVCQRLALAGLGGAARLVPGRTAVLAQDSRGEHAPASDDAPPLGPGERLGLCGPALLLAGLPNRLPGAPISRPAQHWPTCAAFTRSSSCRCG